jgi:magnesium chelatase accessory protein
MCWARDGLDWPNRAMSRFVPAAGLQWHVQEFGSSDTPLMLLIHGTGASTHSWRDLAPLLARRMRVLAVDLPGHGFTETPASGAGSPQFSLPGMAHALSLLLGQLGHTPRWIAGHSAGAAIAVRMCLDGLVTPHRLIGLNGALLPLGGLAGQLFSPMAKLLAAMPFVPNLFAWRAADPVILQRLIRGTGSRLDAQGEALYGRLIRNPAHAGAALAMMANWDLHAFARDLPRLTIRLDQWVGENDLTISPGQARQVQDLLGPAATGMLTALPGLGHLAHEEQPALLARLLLNSLQPPGAPG